MYGPSIKNMMPINQSISKLNKSLVEQINIHAYIYIYESDGETARMRIGSILKRLFPSLIRDTASARTIIDHAHRPYTSQSVSQSVIS